MILSLTGPSGVGKTTIAGELILQSLNFRMVTSYTTRLPRENDIAGEYTYISMEQFEELLHKNKFLWRIEHGGNSYGTTSFSIKEVFQEKQNMIGIMILVPEVIPVLRNFLESLGKLNEHILVFIEPPEERVLLSRMQKRGDIHTDAIARLVESADWKRTAWESTLPYTFMRNDGSVKEAVQVILSIVQTVGTL